MLKISSSLSSCCCCKPIDKFNCEFLVSDGKIVVDGGFNLDGSSSGCIFDDDFFVGVRFLLGDFAFCFVNLALLEKVEIVIK